MAVVTPDLAHIYDELLKARDEAEAIRTALLPEESSQLQSLLARIETLLLETEDALDIQEADRRADEPLTSWDEFEASLDAS